MNKKYFTTRIVTGSAFINRKKERDWLANRIKQFEHSWIMAPRRYGKSSLCKQVLFDLQKDDDTIISTEIDLMITYDTKTVETHILDHIGKILSQLFSPTKKSIEIVKSIFRGIAIEVNIDSEGNHRFNLTTRTSDRSKNIIDALLDMDRYAHKKRKKLSSFLMSFNNF